MKNWAWIVLFTIVLTACGGTVATPTALPTQVVPQHTLLGTQGNFRFVVVDKGLANDRKALKSIASAVCDTQWICTALFWDDQSQAASSSPLTEAQTKARIATYFMNLSLGKESLLICVNGWLLSRFGLRRTCYNLSQPRLVNRNLYWRK